MAQAQRYTGKDMVITINAIELTAEYKSLTVKESMNSAEATGGADGHEFSLTTYGAGSVDVEVLGVREADTNYADIQTETAKGSVGPLVWGPEGDATGLPRFTAAGYVESRDGEYKFDDAVGLKFSYKLTASITEDTWP